MVYVKYLVPMQYSSHRLFLQAASGEKKIVKVKVKPYLLFKPTEQFGKLTPDPETDFYLLDRVVNVQNGTTVPVGLRGTVIGIHQGKNGFWSYNSEYFTMK